MVKRIIWSKQRLRIKGIFDYWNKANGNKNYSRKLNIEFNNLVELLLTFPELGRKVENYDARFLIKREYIVFYKLSRDSDSIEILQIWDSRRDPENLRL
jgi:toxin YoeB